MITLRFLGELIRCGRSTIVSTPNCTIFSRKSQDGLMTKVKISYNFYKKISWGDTLMRNRGVSPLGGGYGGSLPRVINLIVIHLTAITLRYITLRVIKIIAIRILAVRILADNGEPHAKFSQDVDS